MKAFSFQLQIQKSTRTAEELIHDLDPRAPIPAPLEGGNMKGPLYECVIDASKQETVMKFWKEGGEALVYTFLYEIEIDESTYRPDYYVHWNFGNPTTVSVEKY